VRAHLPRVLHFEVVERTLGLPSGPAEVGSQGLSFVNHFQTPNLSDPSFEISFGSDCFWKRTGQMAYPTGLAYGVRRVRSNSTGPILMGNSGR
jgi:hypothetical protein